MKLRTKIQVSYCATLVVVLLIVGYVIGITMNSVSMDMVNDSMTTSARLAGNHISQQLKDYMNVVEMVGREDVMSGSASDAQKLAYLDTFIEAYGFTSGNILDSKGISIQDGTDFSDRAYVQQALDGTPNVSDITLSKYTNTYGVSIAAPIRDAKDQIRGVVYFRLDSNFIMDIIDSITISENSYAYLVDAKGNIIAHPKEDMILNYNLNEQTGTMEMVAKKIAEGKAGNGNYTNEGKAIVCGFSPIENTNHWSMVIAAPEKDFTAAFVRVTNILVVLAVISIIIVIFVSSVIAKGVCRPINIVKDALIGVSKGDFSVKVPVATSKDEVAVLQNTTASLLSTLSDIVGQTNEILASIARYDLTVSDMKNYPGEFDSLSASVNSIKYTLNQLIIEVQNSVRNVDTGSRELAQATAALSKGTVAQASSIQSLADNLGVVVERIHRNSEREDQINENLSNLDQQIRKANQQMQDLMAAVNEIETMSSSIQKIVGTIDGIAFQTNILSLNASVEAARAGEMGSGFAVVAEEVRSLAEKCGESSRRTSDLISQCIFSIDNAKQCADATFESLTGIVSDSSQVAKAFEEITKDTSEQAAKSKHIQGEINVISDVIQTNTATVEETAASTSVLSEQAMNLESMVRNFKVAR